MWRGGGVGISESGEKKITNKNQKKLPITVGIPGRGKGGLCWGDGGEKIRWNEKSSGKRPNSCYKGDLREGMGGWGLGCE